MKILVVDNYDSFTYNLVHILRELQVQYDVYRNDKIEIREVNKYDKILLSPGPSMPSEAGLMPQIIEEYKMKKSILGVCLGHQGIGECFGAKLYNLPQVFHGIVTDIYRENEDKIYENVPKKFKVCRYHSWVVSQDHFPEELTITSKDQYGTIMSFVHKKYPVWGLQFHPESILSEYGKKIMENWIKI